MAPQTSSTTILIEKLSAAFQARRPLSLSNEEIELILAAGALTALSTASLNGIETQARQRVAERSISSAAGVQSKGVTPLRVDDDQPFSVKSLAEHWGVSDSLIRKVLRSGELEHFKLGGQLIRIPAKAVADFESRHAD